jgi:hypothetical protein
MQLALIIIAWIAVLALGMPWWAAFMLTALIVLQPD